MAGQEARRGPLRAAKVNGNGHAPDRVIPNAPGDLEAAGLAVWGAVWAETAVAFEGEAFVRPDVSIDPSAAPVGYRSSAVPV